MNIPEVVDLNLRYVTTNGPLGSEYDERPLDGLEEAAEWLWYYYFRDMRKMMFSSNESFVSSCYIMCDTELDM